MRGSWVLVSPHRTKRPWQSVFIPPIYCKHYSNSCHYYTRGQQEAASKSTLPAYDPSCYLCPGNKRAQGDTNPKYDSTLVFVNDYSAVKEEQTEYHPEDQDGGMHEVSHLVPCEHEHLGPLVKTSRPLLPPPPRRTRHRQMLCDNLFAFSQPHSRRPSSFQDTAYNPYVDTALRCASFAHICSGGRRTSNHDPSTEP